MEPSALSLSPEQFQYGDAIPARQGPKPEVPMDKTAPEYSHTQLLELTKWVMSDNVASHG